jgi:hypothetical protein
MTTRAPIPVHPGNPQEACDGQLGTVLAAHDELFERSLADFIGPFLDAASIGRADRLLAIGFGAAAARAPQRVEPSAVEYWVWICSRRCWPSPAGRASGTVPRSHRSPVAEPRTARCRRLGTQRAGIRKQIRHRHAPRDHPAVVTLRATIGPGSRPA